MDVKLMLGDCLEAMKEIPDDSIDMILCDLPYGKTQNKWDKKIPLEPLWEQFKRIIKDKGPIVMFSAQPFTSELIMSQTKLFKYDLIWDKHLSTGFLNAKRMPLRKHETICVFCKGSPNYYPQMEVRGKVRSKGGRGEKHDGGKCCGTYGKHISYNNIYYPTSILSFSNANRKQGVHSTQKPVPLLEYLIKTYTNEGETVLDSCMGSGSTGVACVNTGRSFIGIELDEQYFKTAKSRIEFAIAEKEKNK